MASNSLSVYNPSTLSGSHFTFSITGYPNLNFTLQTVNLPGVQTNPREIPTPVGSTHVAGDKLGYEPLIASFIVDETLNNWREMYGWMRALSPTNLIEDEGALANNQYVTYDKPLYSIGMLYILTNSLNINLKLKYTNLFPISLSGLQFSTQDKDDRKLFANVTFAYDYYDITVSESYNSNGFVPNNVIS